jgi:hypothetical protein
MLPDKSLIVEHDFSRGPWWPEKTFDIAWAVEFLEHVNLHYHYNYISTFRKAAILMVTSSRWGGWHHVEVRPDSWWIRKYEMYGFKFSQELTDQIRKIVDEEKGQIFPPTGQRMFAQHIGISIKVFINPLVAALPEHAHLFGGVGGCHKEGLGESIVNRECGEDKETPLDPTYFPLKLTEEQDEAWYNIIKANVDVEKMKMLLGGATST